MGTSSYVHMLRLFPENMPYYHCFAHVEIPKAATIEEATDCLREFYSLGFAGRFRVLHGPNGRLYGVRLYRDVDLELLTIPEKLYGRTSLDDLLKTHLGEEIRKINAPDVHFISVSCFVFYPEIVPFGFRCHECNGTKFESRMTMTTRVIRPLLGIGSDSNSVRHDRIITQSVPKTEVWEGYFCSRCNAPLLDPHGNHVLDDNQLAKLRSQGEMV